MSFKDDNLKPSAAKKPRLLEYDELPRIDAKLNLRDLREEAAVRGHQPKDVPRIKADLLHFLVDGSIHLSKTSEYKAFVKMKERIETERDALLAKSLANKRAEKAKAEAKLRAKEEKRAAEQRAARQKEIETQKKFHIHSCPKVHDCKLAKTAALRMNGLPRIAWCSSCQSRVSPEGGFTCEACNFDICSQCYIIQNMDAEEKRSWEREEAKKHEREAAEAARHRKEEEDRIKQEEQQRLARYDTKQFKAAIMKPSDEAKNPNSSLKGNGFAVWCSDGYGNDGWHSYNEPPDKMFDTTWNTLEEANSRARYLFYHKSPWGLHPEELLAEGRGDPEEMVRENGLMIFQVEPPDSSIWTVGVVPAQSFQHLDHAVMQRHNHDREVTYYSAIRRIRRGGRSSDDDVAF